MKERARRVLVLSTTGFTVAFAVWMMFGVLGIPIRKELGLDNVQMGWLLAASVLSGSILRLHVGILTDQYGGRVVFALLLLLAAVPTFLVSTAHSYRELLIYAALFGLAGNTFASGIAWCSAWYPQGRQGFALGVFGAGNVGASATKFIGPLIIATVPAAGLFGGIIPGGWRFVPVLYTALLLIMAAAVWFLSPHPDRMPGSHRTVMEMMHPLKYVRTWRFSLYYVVVFGAYVAMSLWMPKFYVDVYKLELPSAALLTATFIFPASLLRPLGGWLSDKWGARPVLYAVFWLMIASTLLLSIPGLPLGLFVALVFMVGVAMGIGKASVYKYIPQYFPNDVGAVGGQVGLFGALGGFFLPPIFGYLVAWTGIHQTMFMVLLLLSAISLAWLHRTVLRILKTQGASSKAFEETKGKGELPCQPV